MLRVSAAVSRTATIGRISEGRRRWRVLVRSWQERDSVRGCLLFEADDAPAAGACRASPVILHGPSHEAVLLMAHDLPEDKLRRVLHSLG
jgi:hypothetical protein